MELPGPPARTVFDPHDSEPPVIKRKLPLRAVLIPVLLLSLGAGAIYLTKVTAGPTPDERAKQIARLAAQDALVAVFSTDETKEAAAQDRIRAMIDEKLEGSGCTWVAGSMAFGDTSSEAARAADKAITAAKAQKGDTADEYGVGYVVVRGSGMYVAVLAAIHCAPPSPAVPGGLGS